MTNTMTSCPSCKGSIKPGETIFTARIGDGILLIENVPAEICSQCGEKWFSDEVMEKLEVIGNDVRKRHFKIEIMNFDAA